MKNTLQLFTRVPIKMHSMFLVLGLFFISADANTQPIPTITTQDILCFGECNGTASVTFPAGVGATYDWSTGGTGSVETGLCPGSYSVTITDDVSNYAIGWQFTIGDPGQLEVWELYSNSGNPNVCDGTTHFEILGGTSPFTLNLPAGASAQVVPANITGAIGYTVTGLCDGTYDISDFVSDANSCTAPYAFIIGAANSSTLSAQLVANVVLQDALCFGDCNGTATVSVSGGTGSYTYDWSSGGSGSTESGLCPGNYGVAITDIATNEIVIAAANIEEPEELGIAQGGSSLASDASGPNICDGAAFITVIGGTPPFTLNLPPGITAQIVPPPPALPNGTSYLLSGFCGGSHQLPMLVTDANSCTRNGAYFIPTNNNIPTLGEWGLLCFALLLMIVGCIDILQPSRIESKGSRIYD